MAAALGRLTVPATTSESGEPEVPTHGRCVEASSVTRAGVDDGSMNSPFKTALVPASVVNVITMSPLTT